MPYVCDHRWYLLVRRRERHVTGYAGFVLIIRVIWPPSHDKASISFASRVSGEMD